MKIGLLSDTHSHLDHKVFAHFEECDEVWHAGDIGNIELCNKLQSFKPLIAVYGNIDGYEIRSSFPEDQIFEREGFKVWMTHIGGYPPKYTAKIKSKLDELNPNLFVCGHSHILKVISDPSRKLIHLNPGACGKHGFHQVKTLLRFELHDQKISNMQVIELGERA